MALGASPVARWPAAGVEVTRMAKNVEPMEVATGSRNWSAAQAEAYYRQVGARVVGTWPLGGTKRVTSAGIKLRTLAHADGRHSVELIPDGCVC